MLSRSVADGSYRALGRERLLCLFRRLFTSGNAVNRLLFTCPLFTHQVLILLEKQRCINDKQHQAIVSLASTVLRGPSFLLSASARSLLSFSLVLPLTLPPLYLQTVLWIGAVGLSDRKPFANGSLSLAETLSELTRAERCTSIVHGKDVEKALKSVCGQVSHVTLGGSAAVTLLTGGALPGLAALDEVTHL